MPDNDSSALERAKKNIARGEKAIRGDEPKWHEALAFFGNDQWVEVNAVSNELDRLETREGGEKPRHRPRLTRNRMTSKVLSEVSMLTSRTPAWQVDPPNGDPGADNQAQLAEKVLMAKHGDLGIDSKAVNALIYSILTGTAVAWPYWDPDVGRVVAEGEGGKTYCEGDVGIKLFHSGEVLWEPGVPFEDSGWHAIRKAVPVSTVRSQATRNGDKIKPNARGGMWERPGNELGEMAFTYEYLEKPSKGNAGLWMRLCGGHEIRERREYPRKDGQPALHKLAWIPRPDRHRDLGAGEMLVDCQRSYNRGHNQVIQWRTLALVPQMLAPEGSVTRELTDEAGVIIEYRVMGGQIPQWREVPEIPATLFETMDRALADMDEILGNHELPSGIESGSGIEAYNAHDQSRRGLFIRALAGWYAAIGQHVLELIHDHYTEPRLIELQGLYGPEQIPDFLGRDLGKIGKVRVKPSSLEGSSREAREKRILYYADRGWVEPHRAMRALDAGTDEALITELELDQAKQQREIRSVINLVARLQGTDQPQVLRELEMEDSGRLSSPNLETPIAGEHDNHAVHMDELRIWMKTRDFEIQHPLVQAWAQDHYAQHEVFTVEAELRDSQQAAIKARALGDANAAREPGVKLPSQPSEDTLGSQAG